MESTVDVGSATTGGANGTFGAALAPSARPRAGTAKQYQQFADEDRGTGGLSLSDFLGFFSIGLGLAEVLAPGGIARVCGVDPDDERNRNVIRLMGAREISHGLAILTSQTPEKAVWSRVAGDALDLALLGRALANPDNDRTRTMFATMNVLAVSALDVMCARKLSMQPETARTEAAEQGIIHTRRAITIWKPVEEVYAFWRNPENFPQFMRHVESVEVIDSQTARWTVKAPAGQSVSWTAAITEERENELISWVSLPDADVYNAGTVRFTPAPGGRGTEVRLDLEYEPPFGKLGSKLAMLWREEPGQQAQDDLRHLKQVMELGEIVISDATKQRGMHPGQPNDQPIEL